MKRFYERLENEEAFAVKGIQYLNEKVLDSRAETTVK